MTIIIRRPWTRQPQSKVGIDRSNPLTRGLVNALTFNGAVVDAAQNKLVSSSVALGTPQYTATPSGVGLWLDGSSGAFLDLNEDWSGPCTVIATTLLRSVDSPWGSLLSKVGSGGTKQFSIYRHDTTDNFAFQDISTYALQLTSSSISAASGAIRTVAFVNEGSYFGAFVNYYLNGAPVQIGAAVDGGQNSGVGGLYLGCGQSPSASDASDVTFLSLLRFNRVLSSTEIARIGNNPWQLFAPRQTFIPQYTPVIPNSATAIRTGLGSAIPRFNFTRN